MAIQILGYGGTIAEVDTNRNLLVAPGIPATPSTGGWYTVTGGTTAVVAASLAADTMLMSMRLSASSTRTAYVYRFDVMLGAATIGSSALVAGTLGLRRFTAQTPTGGNARTVQLSDGVSDQASDMTDVRDSNAALTGTAPTWPANGIIAQTIVPIFINGAMWAPFSFVAEPYPIKMVAGDGLALRTIVAMPGTQTWMYSYNVQWYEV